MELPRKQISYFCGSSISVGESFAARRASVFSWSENWDSALTIKSLQKKQKLSRKDAKAQRFRKERPSAGQTVYCLVFGRLCVFFASLRLCVSASFWLRIIRKSFTLG